jgi:hypothetical protein
MSLRRFPILNLDPILALLVLLALMGVACSGGGDGPAEPGLLPTPDGNGFVDQDLGFAFRYPETWVAAEPCSMPLAPFNPCRGSLYRPVSPGEQASGAAGAPVFVATLASPGDPELGIMGAVTGQGRPFEGVYFAVRRLPEAVSATDYAETMQTRLRSAISASRAALLDSGSRQIGGSDWLWARYELKSWGQCIYLGAGGCVLATGRVWAQAFTVRGDLEYMISCEGSSQRSRFAKSGPPKLEPFDVLEKECQVVFESFLLQEESPEARGSTPATLPATNTPTPPSRPAVRSGEVANLAPDPSFETADGVRPDWLFFFGAQSDLGGWEVDSTVAHSGSRSVRIDGRVFVNARGECMLPVALGQWRTTAPISIDTGKSYEFSAWHLGETLGPAGAYDGLGITFLDAGGTRLSDVNIGVTTADPGWAEGSLSIQPPYPVGTRSVRLSLGYAFSMQQPLRDPCPVGETLSIWYDDVEFREVP